MYSVRDEWIYFANSLADLKVSIKDYTEQHFPGASGSIDIVHVKWSKCPACDFNKCKRNESFPSVAFECVTINQSRVLGIAPIQFAPRSDKHIVWLDPTVSALMTSWYKDVKWEYYNIGGELKRSTVCILFVMEDIYAGKH